MTLYALPLTWYYCKLGIKNLKHFHIFSSFEVHTICVSGLNKGRLWLHAAHMFTLHWYTFLFCWIQHNVLDIEIICSKTWLQKCDLYISLSPSSSFIYFFSSHVRFIPFSFPYQRSHATFLHIIRQIWCHIIEQNEILLFHSSPHDQHSFPATERFSQCPISYELWSMKVYQSILSLFYLDWQWKYSNIFKTITRCGKLPDHFFFLSKSRKSKSHEICL